MAGDGEGRENDSEELFEDLDKFFAPIQGVDWPEPASEDSGTDKSDAESELPRTPEPHPAEAAFASDAADDAGSGVVTDSGAAEWADETPAETEFASIADAGSTSDPGYAGAGEVVEIEEEEPAFDSSYMPAPDESWGSAESAGETPAAEPIVVDDADGTVEVIAGDTPSLEREPDVIIDDTAVIDVEAVDVDAAAEHFAEGVRTEHADGESDDISGDILADLGAEPDDEPRKVSVGPEGMHGPSWQEPASEDVGADPGAPGEKNIPAAFLTGVVMAAIALGALALGRAPFAILAGALILFAQGEFYAVLHKRHYQPATALGLVFGALTLAAGYFHGEAAVLSMIALCVIFCFLWEMATPARHRKDMMMNIALTLLGVLYIPLLASFGMVMLQIEPAGRALILAVLGLTFVYDTVAFGIGSLWGDHPMAPSISPRKSWEGAAGATLVVILVSMVAATSILDMGVGNAIGLGIVIAIFAPFGDLAESMIKRDLRVKDMGNLLPGHGGVIDRVDAVLFVLPAAWIFLRVALGG